MNPAIGENTMSRVARLPEAAAGSALPFQGEGKGYTVAAAASNDELQRHRSWDRHRDLGNVADYDSSKKASRRSEMILALSK
jgi:hypothetical protein